MAILFMATSYKPEKVYEIAKGIGFREKEVWAFLEYGPIPSIELQLHAGDLFYAKGLKGIDTQIDFETSEEGPIKNPLALNVLEKLLEKIPDLHCFCPGKIQPNLQKEEIFMPLSEFLKDPLVKYNEMK